MRRLFPIFILLALAACDGSSGTLLSSNDSRSMPDPGPEVTGHPATDTPSPADTRAQDSTQEDSVRPMDVVKDTTVPDTISRDTAPPIDTAPPLDTLMDSDTDQPEMVADADVPDMMDASGGAGGGCAPRWVVTDATGTELEVLVLAPSWGVLDPVTPGVDINGFPSKCISLRAIGNVPTHNAQYSLQTGEMAECYPESPFAYYRDSACDIPISQVMGNIAFGKFQGEVMAAWGNTVDYAGLGGVYIIGSGGGCSLIPVSNPQDYWSYKPLPSGFPTTLPGTPPYTLSVAY